MKNILTIIAIATLIFTTSCGKEKTKVTDTRTTVNVKVNTPSSESNSFISASGKIEAVQSANISTRMMGFVNNIHVNVGDKVSKGQLLLSINSTDISAQKAQVEASITEATAAFKNAEKDYNRFTALFKENSASQKEMDDISANYEMSKARLEAANQMKNQVNAQLSYSNIKAPFSGVITGKFVNKGDMANPGMPLISIETPGKYQIISMIPESEITSIKKGTNVSVTVKSTNQLVTGKVTEVSSSAKNTGGQYLVKVVLNKTDVKLLSGMFTSVQFPIEKDIKAKSNVVLVPQSALITQGQLTGVYTIGNENVAILRWLRVGKTFDNQVEVLSGLSANEQYIVSADGKLYNGAKISIQH
ncbi:MAG: efflux RND transporter periplasmic adaptor subunit [Lutibacter sp.]|uniref:efflux RND transporter periplasmic adaptor subunit n=1 Tax=Lutibacter sp. TaxID=1925666 RepID=UPI0019E7A861|nr:efflux RND transporter periplasmic adaptor subunit [Lutibacter sp.]NOR27340.1 efflux RND transporter periplasmic adaptor subunit [Lutibacter sp.]